MAPKRQVARKSCGGWAPKKALATRQPRRKRSNGGWGTGIESLSRESEAPADQCQMMEVSDDPLTADILSSGMKAMQGILKQRLKEATEKERLAYEANLAKKNAELASLRKDKEQELASKDAQLACLSKESEKIRIQFEAYRKSE